MKKTTTFLATLILTLGVSEAFADNNVVLKFNTTAVTLAGAQYINFHYSGHPDRSPITYSNYQEIVSEPHVDLSDINDGVTLSLGRLNGNNRAMSYTYTNNTALDHFGIEPPTSPVCNLQKDFKPGDYEVILGTEPLYIDGGVQLGYWITCTIHKR